MPRRKSNSLEEVKMRFDEWRRNRKGKAAIPDELWLAAADVARRERVEHCEDDSHTGRPSKSPIRETRARSPGAVVANAARFVV